MTTTLAAKLLNLQEPDGSFHSTVSGPGWNGVDHNGFTAALVLRSLRHLSADPSLDRLRDKALSYIERCRAEDGFGFTFWPADGWPPSAPALPADVDDTAIMTVELIRGGRLTRRDGLRTVLRALLPHRQTERSDGHLPPWIRSGAFRTWFDSGGKPNPVDCCINANVAALMALVDGRQVPGYEAAIGTVVDGVAWAGDDRARQQAITPFYPTIDGLVEAVDHAVDCGVTALQPTLERLRRLDRRSTGTAGCCCAAYGRTVWRCPALEHALLALRGSADRQSPQMHSGEFSARTAENRTLQSEWAHRLAETPRSD